MNPEERTHWKTPEIGRPVYSPAGIGESGMLTEYRRRCATPSDINELLPKLFALAAECRAICEFGVREGNSTIALLAGLETRASEHRPGIMHSWDIEEPQLTLPSTEWMRWSFEKRDTAHLGTIPACDLLFIDTAHTGVHVEAELQYEAFVRRWIVFHDTVLYGIVGMDGRPGVLCAAIDFLARNPTWRVKEHLTINNGLLILERCGAPSGI